MESKLQLEDIEKAVSAHFSGNDINKDQLKRISKSIAAITKSGLEVIDWSIFGQPPFERLARRVAGRGPARRAPYAEDGLGPNSQSDAQHRGLEGAIRRAGGHLPVRRSRTRSAELRLQKAFAGGGAEKVRSLRLDKHAENRSCWLHHAAYCLSRRP